MTHARSTIALASVIFALVVSPASHAHKLRKQGVDAAVAQSPMVVTPSRDWNQLSANVGKKTETWTLDGAQLNEVTFFGGIAPGQPLVRERNKKSDPLPKFSKDTLLIEVTELLEGTYRTSKGIASFQLNSVDPSPFLGKEGVKFAYEFTDDEQLTRQGEARAAIVGGNLYMITFDSPRLHYFGEAADDFRALATSARLP